MRITPCTIDEMHKALKEGKKVVVYGDTVVYDPKSGMEPHTWYRKQIYNASIAVNVGVLDDSENKKANI